MLISTNSNKWKQKVTKRKQKVTKRKQKVTKWKQKVEERKKSTETDIAKWKHEQKVMKRNKK